MTENNEGREMTADDYLARAAKAEVDAAFHRREAERFRKEAAKADRMAKIVVPVIVVLTLATLATLVDVFLLSMASK